jgi:thiol-disulfide isomerase/thioredoxin
MESLKNFNYNFSSKKFLIIIILIALFLGAAVYVYNKYIAPRLNPTFVSNREFTQQETVESAELYFMFAEWCPYSKKVLPIWDKLKEKYNRKKVKDFAVEFKEYDGDKNEKEINEFSTRFNKKIDGYPTIILIKHNEVIEFDADPTEENLVAFIERTL